jgi:chloramphenicol-sensitive protein RarD
MGDREGLTLQRTCRESANADAGGGQTLDRAGFLYALAAYGWWGLMPLYFEQVKPVEPLELLAHRIVWSILLLALLLTGLRRWAEVWRCLRSAKTLRLLLVTTVLLAVNWLAYIYCAWKGHLVQASLGYFILPLVNIVLGMVFLGERLHGVQWLPVALAALGMSILIAFSPEPPWIALMIAFSFSVYGLLRKRVGLDGLTGLTVETLLLAPLAGGYLLWLTHTGNGIMGAKGNWLDAMLLLSGVVTTVPLYCFAEAARRVPLTSLGFMQYLSPTLQLILAVTRGGEEFGSLKQVSFGLIWAALLVFTLTSLRPRALAVEADEAR